MACSRRRQSCPGATWPSIEDDHITRSPGSSPYHEAKEFSLSVQDHSGADRVDRTQCLCTIQKRLVVAGYLPRHPNRCPRLIHNHRCHQWLLEDRPLNWNCQHWSHAIFDDESRVSLYHSDNRAVMELSRQWKRLKDKIELWLILHEKIRGLTMDSWTKTRETSAAGSSSGVCVPKCGGGGVVRTWFTQ